MPRPILSRLVARAIERLDEMDGDCELEVDDEPEEDDHSGGADEAEPEHDLFPSYGDDQSRGPTGVGYEPKRRRL